MSSRPRFRIALVLLAVAVLCTAAAAEDVIYVQVEGVQGDSQDQDHQDWIDAYALSQTYMRTCPPPPQSCSPAEFGDIMFLKGVDSATVPLHQLQLQQDPRQVVIDICRRSVPQECYYRIELEQARFKQSDFAGTACGDTSTCTPDQTESLGLTFRKIRWIFTPFRNGNPETPIEYCWDPEQNAPC